MKYIKINWNETYKIPKDATDYQDYNKGTQARREMFKLQNDVATLFDMWLRDVPECYLSKGGIEK